MSIKLPAIISRQSPKVQETFEREARSKANALVRAREAEGRLASPMRALAVGTGGIVTSSVCGWVDGRMGPLKLGKGGVAPTLLGAFGGALLSIPLGMPTVSTVCTHVLAAHSYVAGFQRGEAARQPAA